MKFLLFITQPYSIGILEPLIEEIKKSNQGESLIFISPKIEKLLPKNAHHTTSIKKAIGFAPDIVFASGNIVHYKIPGIKVQVFHGLCEEKMGHYKINGLFDLYCTSGPLVTEKFKILSHKLKYFKVIETGWIKIDKLLSGFDKELICEKMNIPSDKKIILYTPTFSPRFKSSDKILPMISSIPNENELWILKFHDLMNKDEIEQFKKLPKEKFKIFQSPDNTELLQIADVLISDTSSIVYEFMLLDKPVITIDAKVRIDKGINISDVEELRDALNRSLISPNEFSKNRKKYLEQIHPYQDRENAKRVLQATIQFFNDFKQIKLKRKPLNIFRKYKIRKKFGL